MIAQHDWRAALVELRHRSVARCCWRTPSWARPERGCRACMRASGPRTRVCQQERGTSRIPGYSDGIAKKLYVYYSIIAGAIKIKILVPGRAAPSQTLPAGGLFLVRRAGRGDWSAAKRAKQAHRRRQIEHFRRLIPACYSALTRSPVRATNATITKMFRGLREHNTILDFWILDCGLPRWAAQRLKPLQAMRHHQR